MKTMYLILTCVVLGFLSGCASITGTTNQSISVETREKAGVQVAGAACELTNNKGKWFVTSPGSVMIHRSNDDMQVLCDKAGYEPGRAAVVSETKGSMFGNIIFGGGIGAIVDHNNGSAYEYPTFIQIVMGSFAKIEPVKQPPSDQQTSNSINQYQTVPATQTIAMDNSAAGQSSEERLKELKRLSDSGLITQDVYVERQKKILDSTK